MCCHYFLGHASRLSEFTLSWHLGPHYTCQMNVTSDLTSVSSHQWESGMLYTVTFIITYQHTPTPVLVLSNKRTYWLNEADILFPWILVIVLFWLALHSFIPADWRHLILWLGYWKLAVPTTDHFLSIPCNKMFIYKVVICAKWISHRSSNSTTSNLQLCSQLAVTQLFSQRVCVTTQAIFILVL